MTFEIPDRSELPPEEILFHLRAGRLLRYGPHLDRWWVTHPGGAMLVSAADALDLIEFNWVRPNSFKLHVFEYNWNAEASLLTGIAA